MSQPLAVVSVRSTNGRLILAASILAALAITWFGVRWQVGSMIAEFTSPNDPGIQELAKSARDLAPGNPFAAWLYASANRDLITPENVDPSVRLFEDVVRLAPNDYRWWIELGRVAEQARYRDKAEAAFRKAVELAPSYAYPHWQMGNFLLRAGRTDEALEELRKAALNNYTYRQQVFSLAWDYFDRDPARVEALAADTPDSLAGLAYFFAARGQAADSLRVWNTLTKEQKEEYATFAKTIANVFTVKQFFRQGLEFSRQTGIDPDSRDGAVTNGGFEKSIGEPNDNNYGWNVERGDIKLDINIDPSVRHSGDRSLRVNFRVYTKPLLANPSQIIVVDPGGSYTLRFWVRTENLRSAGMPLVEIIETTTYGLVAASSPIATGSNDWQEMTVEFKAPRDSEGVVIRLGRSYCGEGCPLVGILWLDDFSLTKN